MFKRKSRIWSDSSHSQKFHGDRWVAKQPDHWNCYSYSLSRALHPVHTFRFSNLSEDSLWEYGEAGWDVYHNRVRSGRHSSNILQPYGPIDSMDRLHFQIKVTWQRERVPKRRHIPTIERWWERHCSKQLAIHHLLRILRAYRLCLPISDNTSLQVWD